MNACPQASTVLPWGHCMLLYLLKLSWTSRQLTSGSPPVRYRTVWNAGCHGQLPTRSAKAVQLHFGAGSCTFIEYYHEIMIVYVNFEWPRAQAVAWIVGHWSSHSIQGVDTKVDTGLPLAHALCTRVLVSVLTVHAVRYRLTVGPPTLAYLACRP